MKIIIKVMLSLFGYFACLPHSFGQNSLVVSIPFKVNNYTIDEQYLPMLDTLVQKCKASKQFQIRMFAFTDTTGTEEYNDRLSAKRGEAVYNYINAKLPLNGKNTYYSWQGEFEEKYDLHFNEAHVQQRYVDIKVQLYNK